MLDYNLVLICFGLLCVLGLINAYAYPNIFRSILTARHDDIPKVDHTKLRRYIFVVTSFTIALGAINLLITRDLVLWSMVTG